MSRSSHFTLVTAAAALALVAVSSGTAVAAPSVTYTRVQGEDRYVTAAAIAENRPGGQAGVVMLARGDFFADGLTASNLGSSAAVPLLLTQPNRLNDHALQAMKNLGTSYVYIIGGPAALSEQVERDLEREGIGFERIFGDDRYGTATATMYRFYSGEGDRPRQIDGKNTVIIASGEQFPDALAAGPLAFAANLPVLLAGRTFLPEPTRRALEQEGPSRCPNVICIHQVLLLGGPDAVSAEVQREIEGMGVTVRRVAGATRQETAVSLARFARDVIGWPISHFNLTRGDDFPDALAGGPHGGRERSPILLTTDPQTLSEPTRQFLQENAPTIESFDVFGDETAVSESAAGEAREASTTG